MAAVRQGQGNLVTNGMVALLDGRGRHRLFEGVDVLDAGDRRRGFDILEGGWPVLLGAGMVASPLRMVWVMARWVPSHRW